MAELVLEYLASKGFASAEAALREQLESEPMPLPSDQYFSTLEAMILCGAQEPRPKGSITTEMTVPAASDAGATAANSLRPAATVSSKAELPLFDLPLP